ncbi:AAC(3) family N-acetyltransferase [Halobacteria archaeon AArc-m2/3/4]|uniref:AAC(3) family N-acetyltransferase n=1 Tax=Natronoglomus mannanivorans TaxID=2979990 RepID=A0AAP2Z0I6_9EURY|nr:AAC(3) family N-acetyltransferase [Halobacteria archaeon AArc-xg1-1]MCU4973815.1 AAC(3) family N-acetyltransferase [Halobacteria archaeon AArc-m2/3/4]
MTDHITRAGLTMDLRALGLKSGDELVVHGSLSSLGRVEGGAETVVDALLDVAGDKGTVVAPTFTSGLAEEEPFDPEQTPSQTGAITEALRTREDAVRSEHPTHSVAAIGPSASSLTRNHAYDRSLGRNSPLHRLAKHGGQILLLGVGHDRNSSIHVAEALASLPYRTGTKEVQVLGDDGTATTVDVSRVGCGRGFPVLEPVAERADLLTHGNVGQAPAQLMDGEDILRVAYELVKKKPGALLCDDPDCWWCPEARAVLEAESEKVGGEGQES